MDRLIQTVVGIVVAVGASGAIFVGANKWFDQVRADWRRFGVITGSLIGFALTAILIGNKALAWSPSRGTVLTPYLLAIFTALFAVWAASLAGRPRSSTRLILGIGGGAVIGLLYAVFMPKAAFPALEVGPLAIWTVALAGVGAAISAARRRPVLGGGLVGAALGWLIGAFGAPALGAGSQGEAIVAATVLGAIVGARLGIAEPIDDKRRDELHRRAQATIFLAPALGFIAWALILPTIRTIYLSLLDRRGEIWVGIENYKAIFSDPNIFKTDEWPEIFTSRLFYAAVALAVVGVIIGWRMGRRSGRVFESNGISLAPIALGVFLFGNAAFSNLRGTIFNNLWWIFTVTTIVTVLGLAIAVLADRARFESIAKSIIFMPMAISFVGAAIIWRFMYIARPDGRTQTGVLNAIWVWLGQVSNSGGRYVAAALLAAFVAFLAYLAWRGYDAGSEAMAVGAATAALPALWLIYRFLGPGIGGFVIAENGEVVPQTVKFLTEIPFNNLWLMVPFMWIYVGFAMVIFSAAIKGVPADLLEAAKVDGATETQTFWRVTVPIIAPTIGVVITTLIVVVAKVFDIVKVMTNGNFDTEVLANEMWQKAFTELNFGLGAALAVLIFILVLPIMVLNIRRMQQEAL